MTDATDKDAEAQRVLEDRPHTQNRGWQGLAADPGELVAFAGAVGAIAAIVAVTLLFGLPGLLLTFVLLTIVIFGVLLVISMGS